jgi:hypothetical protein
VETLLLSLSQLLISKAQQAGLRSQRKYSCVTADISWSYLRERGLGHRVLGAAAVDTAYPFYS